MLDRDTILATTEQVLRQHGLAKAGVVDVARVLGVSHTAVYRYFPSKAALREAVTRRWLGRAHAELSSIASAPEPAPDRLRTWLSAVFASKRAAAAEEPALFAAYRVLAGEHAQAATDHVAELLTQLTRIVADGSAAGELAATDPAATARGIFDATTAFHHPAHAAEWDQPGTDARSAVVCELVLTALRP